MDHEMKCILNSVINKASRLSVCDLLSKVVEHKSLKRVLSGSVRRTKIFQINCIKHLTGFLGKINKTHKNYTPCCIGYCKAITAA